MRFVLVMFLLFVTSVRVDRAFALKNKARTSDSCNGDGASPFSDASRTQEKTPSGGLGATVEALHVNVDRLPASSSRSSLEIWRDRCQIAAAIATILAFGVATGTYVYNVQRTQKERMTSAFIRMNDLYRSYLERLIDDESNTLARVELENERTSRTDLHLLWVMSMLESSFLTYEGRKGKFWTAQWDGWKIYIDAWCEHSEVKPKLEALLKNFDENFVATVTRKPVAPHVQRKKPQIW